MLVTSRLETPHTILELSNNFIFFSFSSIYKSNKLFKFIYLTFIFKTFNLFLVIGLNLKLIFVNNIVNDIVKIIINDTVNIIVNYIVTVIINNIVNNGRKNN